MQLSLTFARGLDRPLQPEEAHLLRCLSASGMAKLNADLCRGMPAHSLRHPLLRPLYFSHPFISSLLPFSLFPKGVAASVTMAELRDVFRRAQARRESAAAHLPRAAEALLEHLGHPWPTEVLAMLAEAPMAPLFMKLKNSVAEVCVHRTYSFSL